MKTKREKLNFGKLKIARINSMKNVKGGGLGIISFDIFCLTVDPKRESLAGNLNCESGNCLEE